MAGFYDGDATTSGPWLGWNGVYTVTASATTSGITWYGWNSAYSGTAITTLSTWTAWNNQTIYAQVPAAVQAAMVEQQRANSEQAKVWAEKRKIVEAKAAAFLRRNLSPQQEEEYIARRKFTVHSKDGKRKYEIAGDSGVVFEVDTAGKRIRSFCIHSKVRLPKDDEIVAKKLLLEADEERFLQIANATRIFA